MTTTMLAAALVYAKRGWAVLPLHSPGDPCSCGQEDCSSPAKHPRTPNGLKDATTDTGIIRHWWSEWPDANIGIATGKKSGIVVVDCDVKGGGPEHWSELLDINGAVDTLTAITGGGGSHWVFQAPLATLRNTAGTIAPGIDTRGEGGYIVAPPSIHASGQRYEWDSRVQPTPTPAWLLMMWQPQHSTNGAKPDTPMWVTEALEGGAGEGRRNATATRLAGYFRSKDMPHDVILSLMKPFAAQCTPPMGFPELQKVLDSVARYQAHVRDAGISDPPEFEEKAGGLLYTWTSPGVAILLEQVRRNNQGLQSEITIKALGEHERIVHGPVHYNLTSTSGRETLVRYLNRRWEIDWPEILESLSRLAVAYIRTGDPVRDLREYLHRPSSRWALEPFILDDQPTILFGPGGLGKSLVALAAMVSLEIMTPLLPGVAPEAGHHGLYLDWESTHYEHGERLRLLCEGAQLNPADISALHLTCTGTMGDQVARIKHQIDEQGVTFVVIDSAGLACGGEPEKSESALSFFAALYHLRVPALIIAHQTKSEARGMPFGSVMWHNSARMTWEIQSHHAGGEGGLQIALHNRKSNVSSLKDPEGFRMTWSLGSLTIDKLDIAEVPELAASLPLVNRIAHALYNGPMAVKDLAAATGASATSVSSTLGYHARAGRRFRQELGTMKWELLKR